MKIAVIIPVYNEEQSIAKVIGDIPKGVVSDVIVVNNNSNDNTETAALNAGAKVLFEEHKGYGAACLKGIDFLKENIPDIVIFLDGDYSDFPEEIIDLIKPIKNDDYDFVLGSRVTGEREKGALPLQSRVGSVIAGKLISLFWKVKYTDLGPFRAIKYNKLLELEMQDTWFGWTVEMQIRAAKKNYKILEIPVRYRKRIGKSKITGTLKGTVIASVVILKTIFSELFKKNAI